MDSFEEYEPIKYSLQKEDANTVKPLFNELLGD
jgi:hypothetical protein